VPTPLLLRLLALGLLRSLGDATAAGALPLLLHFAAW
jgi:hypothetical protein